ncbi:hypothetical protein R3Q06_17875 [Rhodococcus erythropolis]|uniref:hypothetical protein n=1 Tax=Rhodococcus erythropolis TaxID=1833 RepID=UPI002948DB3A|nr:hypothetical protein [Rhodococcus erythropolis]MDV6275366.1 hypothetical protein [Rhodococcus erythropolis]
MTRTRTRTRTLLHSTVGAVAVLAAISTGAGISAAAPAGSAAPDLPGTTQTSPYQWSVQNRTDQVLTNGHWIVREAGGTSSRIDFSNSRPLLPYDNVITRQEYSGEDLTWEAAVCYKGKLWSSRPDVPKVNPQAPATFTLETDITGRLNVKSPGGEYAPMESRAGC